MKNNNQIDELFKSKLENREFDIKPEFLDQLNDQLDAMPGRNNRRRFFYFFLSIGLVALTTFVISLFVSDNDTIQQKTDSTSNSIEHVDEHSTSADTNSTAEIEISNQTETGLATETKSEHGSAQSLGEAEMEVAVATKSEGEEEKGFRTTTKSEDGFAQSGGEGETEVATTTKSEGGLAQSGGEEETEVATTTKSEGGLAQSGGEEETEVANTTKTEGGSVQSGGEEETEVVSQTETEEGEAQSSGEPVLSEVKPDEKSNEGKEDVGEVSTEQNLEEVANNASPDSDNDSNNVKKNGWSLQFAMGANYISKRGIVGSPEAISTRTTEEENIWTPEVEVGINYHKNNWLIGSGFNFKQHGENLNYSPITFDSTYVSSYTVIIDSATLDTTLIAIYMDTTLTNDAAMLANKNNRHSYVTVPLSFGYTFNVKQDVFSITPRVGVGVRFLVGGTGTYIADNLKSVFDRRDDFISLSYFGNIEFAYELQKMSVFFAPSYHSTFSTFKGLHRYSGIGAKAGIILKL